MDKRLITFFEMSELLDSFRGIIKEELSAYLNGNDHSSNDELLTRVQAAKILGVSLTTLWQWSKSGIVTGNRINSRVRYKRSDLEKALKKMKIKN